MKKNSNFGLFSVAAAIVTGAVTSSSVYAGGGGSGWTICSAKEIGYSYQFRGYTQGLEIGETVDVFVNAMAGKEYGLYQVESIDLSQDIGIIELSYLPSRKHLNRGADFGSMKIEYLSSSALKDIRVTFTKNGLDKSSSATCITD
jgi:hypothetical protein